MLVGTTANRAHYAWVARHQTVPLGCAGLLGLARRPAVAWTFLRTRGARYAKALLRLARRKRSSEARTDGVQAREDVAVLTHVAVTPGARGNGAGALLIDAFLKRAAAAGRTRVQLVTLEGSRGAGGYYRRHGWTFEGPTAPRDGQVFERFRYELDRLEAAP
ncbi:MAG: GNAT family N-acetyltransferase [Egibacteraceae bacterium]